MNLNLFYEKPKDSGWSEVGGRKSVILKSGTLKAEMPKKTLNFPRA